MIKVLTFRPRWVPEYLLSELSNLWHLSRVPHGLNRHARMIWASGEFSKAHPEVSATAAYKDLGDMLEFGGR